MSSSSSDHHDGINDEKHLAKEAAPAPLAAGEAHPAKMHDDHKSRGVLRMEAVARQAQKAGNHSLYLVGFLVMVMTFVE